MKSDFYADPQNVVILKICQTSPGFIPIVLGGHLHPVRELNVSDYPVAPTLSAEDYVLGLEVLGCRLRRDGRDNPFVQEPASFRSDVWQERARQIQAVINVHWEGRRTEVSDYLHRRVEGHRPPAK